MGGVVKAISKGYSSVVDFATKKVKITSSINQALVKNEDLNYNTKL